jgi:hypothetical protein
MEEPAKLGGHCFVWTYAGNLSGVNECSLIPMMLNDADESSFYGGREPYSYSLYKIRMNP